jgi:hypothetical protein
MNLDTATGSPETLAAAAKVRAFFGHQSVGNNVLGAVPGVYARADVAAPPIVGLSDSPDSTDGYLMEALVGTNEDPQSKMRDFAEIVTGPTGDSLDVALMKFCYVDITADTDVDSLFQQYKSSMEQVSAERPNITLLYATVPLTTGSEGGLKGRIKSLLGRDDSELADNVARERFNALIRGEYQATGRLWDIAAVESTTPDGTRVAGDFEGSEYYSLYRGYASDNGHLNDLGSAEAAAALLLLIGQHARAS